MIAMDEDDYVSILRRVYEWNGIWDTVPARVNATCEWLKNNTYQWIQWLPNIDEYSYRCDSFTDGNLKELVMAYLNGDTRFETIDIKQHPEFIDRTLAFKIFENCIKSADSINDGGVIFSKVFSSMCMIIMFLYGLMIIVFRSKHSIIRAASWKLTFTMIVASCFGMIYPWLALQYNETSMKFSDDSSNINFIYCYARAYVMNISLFVVLCTLTLKAWRLVCLNFTFFLFVFFCFN